MASSACDQQVVLGMPLQCHSSGVDQCWHDMCHFATICVGGELAVFCEHRGKCVQLKRQWAYTLVPSSCNNVCPYACAGVFSTFGICVFSTFRICTCRCMCFQSTTHTLAYITCFTDEYHIRPTRWRSYFRVPPPRDMLKQVYEEGHLSKQECGVIHCHSYIH